MKKHNLFIPFLFMPLVLTFFAMLIGLSIYEMLKQVMHRSMTLWESHVYTIVVGAALATVVAYFMIRKRAAIIDQTIEEIKKRRQAEKELREAKDFLGTVLDNLRDSLVVVDPTNHAILGANKNFLNSCGMDKEETVIGRRCYELLHHRSTPCSPPNDVCPLAETLKTGLHATVEHIHYETDGTVRYVEITAVPLTTGDGEIHQILHLSRDVTKRRRAEQVLLQQREGLSKVSRLATLGEFAASIAHEVNQPLAAILNNARAAQRFLSSDTPPIDEVRDTLQDIIDDDWRASEVIRHLRSFLKRKAPNPAILDINTVIGEVLTLLHHEIADRHVRIVPALGHGIPPVEGNHTELQQVLMNLILNGCDAMANAEPERRQMSIRTWVDESDSVIVAVQDAGTGLDGDKIERVFEPFYTTKPEGLGVGLSISKSIIAAHGGRMWVVNNPEGGATFFFTLPVGREKALQS